MNTRAFHWITAATALAATLAAAASLGISM